jgi:exodeoxyribonuclease VII small subunit
MTEQTEQPSTDESFEVLFARLEQVTELLEKGNVPLDRSVSLFEEGMQLAQRCQHLLTDVEQRVERLQETYDQQALKQEES